jgi:hypothetical protein
VHFVSCSQCKARDVVAKSKKRVERAVRRAQEILVYLAAVDAQQALASGHSLCLSLAENRTNVRHRRPDFFPVLQSHLNFTRMPVLSKVLRASAWRCVVGNCGVVVGMCDIVL